MTTSKLIKRLSRIGLVLLVAGVLPVAALSERGPMPRSTTASNDASSQARVIVKYKAEGGLMRALSANGGGNPMRPQHAVALSQRMGLSLTNGRVLGSRTQGLRASGLSSAQLAARLAMQPDVEWAVPDERRTISALTNDPLLTGGQPVATPTVGQWYMRAPDNTAVSAINAVAAWDQTTGSAAVTVAVLDTGVRFDHPDLAGKLYPGYDFVTSDTVGSDANSGRDSDATDPGDSTTANECSAGERARPSSWHGTQVAGLIGAATNNGIGMAGVGRNVMVLPVRVLGRCGGFDSDIIAAARWAAGLTSDVGSGVSVVNSHPAKVINMSFGGGISCPLTYRELFADLNAVGVSVVVAGGNRNGLAVEVPANCPGAIAVAGVRHVGTKVGYSSIGPEIAIAAPAGNCVNLTAPCIYPLITTINSGLTTPTVNTFSDSFDATLGTSFSAPLVAGTVGLMLSVNPALTASQVKAVLQSSARVFPTSGGESAAAICRAPNGVDQLECYCTTATCGAGLLDVAGAVALAVNPPVSVPVSTPVPAPAPAPAPVPVTIPEPIPVPAPVAPSGGGGGGAMGLADLLALAIAALACFISRKRMQR